MDTEQLALVHYAVTATTAALRRAKADGAFDVVATAMLLTIVDIVRRERGADAIREMMELAEDQEPAALITTPS
jgi:hypothetical protein